MPEIQENDWSTPTTNDGSREEEWRRVRVCVPVRVRAHVSHVRNLDSRRASDQIRPSISNNQQHIQRVLVGENPTWEPSGIVGGCGELRFRYIFLLLSPALHPWNVTQGCGVEGGDAWSARTGHGTPRHCLTQYVPVFVHLLS